MIAAVNDLPFQYQMHSLEEALQCLNLFIDLCMSVEDGHMTNIEKMAIAPDFDCSGELAPGLGLAKIVQYIQPQDRKRYLMGVLKNRDAISVEGCTAPFVFDEKSSRLCAYMKDGVLVSLCSSPVFAAAYLAGVCGGAECTLRNLASQEHVACHQEPLGIRRYHANAGKHKPDRKNNYGKGKVASPMDLDDGTAQELLNKAVLIDGRLYAKRQGRIYTFMKEAPCVYHGYINEQASEHVQKELNKMQWD